MVKLVFCKSLINMVFTKNDNQNYNLKKPQYRVGTGANRIPPLNLFSLFSIYQHKRLSVVFTGQRP